MFHHSLSVGILLFLATGFISCHGLEEKESHLHMVKVQFVQGTVANNTFIQEVLNLEGVVLIKAGKDKKCLVIQFDASVIAPKELLGNIEQMDSTVLLSSSNFIRKPVAFVNNGTGEESGSEEGLMEKIAAESPAIKLPNIFELLPGFNH